MFCVRAFNHLYHQTTVAEIGTARYFAEAEKRELCLHQKAYRQEASRPLAKSKKVQCEERQETSHAGKSSRLEADWEEFDSEDEQADNGVIAQKTVAARATFRDGDAEDEVDYAATWFKPRGKRQSF